MPDRAELVVSAKDAEVLASLAYRGDTAPFEAADVLAVVLTEARLVPHERLPADRVAISSRVIYREDPGGLCHPVALVHPKDADPAAGRVSVLSPVGRALLGRKVGAVVAVSLPSGPVTLCVLSACRRQ